MRWRPLLLCLGLLVVGPAPWHVSACEEWTKSSSDLYNISVGNESLAIVKGRVSWAQSIDSLWHFEDTPKGRRIRFSSNDKWEGLYLTCDPTGKSKTVFLSKRPTDGSYWSVPVPSLGATSNYIEASAGKWKGWFLDVGPKDKKTASRLVILSKRGRICEVAVIAP